MINKLKNNSKIKIISLLSAMVLWMYVMAIVDPEETKLFENIPVTITNKNELNERDLVIYPEQDLTTNIYVTGKLSNLKKVTKVTKQKEMFKQRKKPLKSIQRKKSSVKKS